MSIKYIFKFSISILFYFLLFFKILWPHSQHMKVPRSGIESKLQLRSKMQLWQQWTLQPTVPGMGLNTHLCSDLSHCSWILNPLCHSRSSLYFNFSLNQNKNKVNYALLMLSLELKLACALIFFQFRMLLSVLCLDLSDDT